MRRTTIVLLALSLALFSCGDLSPEDSEAIEDLLQGLEDIAAEQNGADQGGGDDQSDAGSDSDSQQNPPHTDSPNRPPTFGENPPVESYYSVGAGVSVEKYEYSPLDASLGDVADHYDEYFGSAAEREEGTRSDGVDYVRWNDGETFVSAYDSGTFIDVQVQYSD